MKKIKLAICFGYNLYPIGGGSEKSLLGVVNNLNPELFDITIVIEAPKIHSFYLKQLPSSVKVLSVLSERFFKYSENKCVYRSPKGIFRWLAKYYRAKKIITIVNNYDLVIDYEPFIFIDGLMRNKADFVGKVIAWHHNDFNRLFSVFVSKFNKKYNADFFGEIDAMLFVNSATRIETVNKITSAKDIRTYTSYNGMSFLNLIDKSEQKVEDRFDSLLNTKYILMVARLDAQKDHETLLKSFVNIKLKYPDYNLVFCGHGNKIDELQDLVTKLNIVEKVYFLGNVANPYPWIKNCNMFVLSTHYEGLPIVVNEAMLFNRPIIVSDIPPCIEAINYGKCGFSFPVGDVDALTLQIEKVINKDYDEQELIRNQNEFIKQFDINITVKQLEKIILDTVHEKN